MVLSNLHFVKKKKKLRIARFQSRLDSRILKIHFCSYSTIVWLKSHNFSYLLWYVLHVTASEVRILVVYSVFFPNILCSGILSCLPTTLGNIYLFLCYAITCFHLDSQGK